MERDRVYLPKNPSLPTVPSQLASCPALLLRHSGELL